VLHHILVAQGCQNPTFPQRGNNTPVQSCCPTSPCYCCNGGNDATATCKQCPARPRLSFASRPSAPEPEGQDPIDVAVDGDQAPSAGPGGVGPCQMDLTTPRQPLLAGPTCPGCTQGFGGPLHLEEPSLSPAPSAHLVHPRNE